ncbi:hypothetical protein CA984_22005 [Streptosporangium minutum]|uniref:Uncharacterized protein n=1 Tax=Streptosporangium minutum TaxID=569862 RepID=A0A2C9ZLW6_9ACTN|nr:hypothetical protein CA984_22005 [Streptosporangium minutum]
MGLLPGPEDRSPVRSPASGPGGPLSSPIARFGAWRTASRLDRPVPRPETASGPDGPAPRSGGPLF